jgi:hypothetical protein
MEVGKLRMVGLSGMKLGFEYVLVREYSIYTIYISGLGILCCVIVLLFGCIAKELEGFRDTR